MTSVPASPEYLRFVASVTGPDPKWREAVDVDALLELKDEERHEAEVLLIDRLRLDDWRAPPALATAGARGAVMPMKRRLPQANGRMRVAIALALAALEAIPRADEIVAEVLRKGEPDTGLAALVGAEGMKSEVIRDTLVWACLHHPDPDVRCNAAAGLLNLANLTTDPLAWKFRPMYLPLADDDLETRRPAFEDICKLVGLPPEIAG
jgi:hypothetical protein